MDKWSGEFRRGSGKPVHRVNLTKIFFFAQFASRYETFLHVTNGKKLSPGVNRGFTDIEKDGATLKISGWPASLNSSYGIGKLFGTRGPGMVNVDNKPVIPLLLKCESGPEMVCHFPEVYPGTFSGR
jgi:hypothetical protein